MRLIFLIYNILLASLVPVLRLSLKRRLIKGKEDQKRFRERYGVSSFSAPNNRCIIWIHAVSVGESVSVVPLIENLASYGKLHILVTTNTMTAAIFIKEKLLSCHNISHQFIPFDYPAARRRFLDHWKPKLAIFVESEIWPGFIHDCELRNIPHFIINARLSPRSFKRWRLVAPLFRCFLRKTIVLAQDKTSASRFEILLNRKIAVTGNLKYDSQPLSYDDEGYQKIKQETKERFIFVAASLHKDEVGILLAAHNQLKERWGGALLSIFVPRHPETASFIVDSFHKMNKLKEGRSGSIALRSGKKDISWELIDLYVADTIGELGLFYKLAHLVFIGGTFGPHGGHNPFEPALFAKPLLAGPSYFNFQDIFHDLIKEEAVWIAHDLSTLLRYIYRLKDQEQRMTQGKRAKKVAFHQQGGLEKTLAVLEPYIRPLTLYSF